MSPSPQRVFTERDRTDAEAGEIDAWADRLEQLGHLYRYTTLAGDSMTWFTRLVLHSEMYFTPFSQLNDPFEGVIQPVLGDASGQEIRDHWTSWFAEDGRTLDREALARIDYLVEHAQDPVEHSRIRAVQREEMAKLGVRCFSETPDDLPMWAYYADSHRGVCLRFRAPLMLYWGGFPPIPITYSDERPQVSFYRTSRFGQIRAEVGTKAKVWSHEREWRMVQRQHGPMNFRPDAFDGVILGCRIERESEEKVRALVTQRRGLQLFKARPADREFRLLIEAA